MRRADHIPQNAWVQIRWPVPNKYVRNVNINFNQWSSFNFDGDRLDLGFNFNAHWQFQNQWSTGFGVNLNTDGFDDRLTRGGPGGRYQRQRQQLAVLQHQRRATREPGWNSNFGNDRQGSRWCERRASHRACGPTTGLSAEFGIGYNNSINDCAVGAAKWPATRGAALRLRPAGAEDHHV